MSEERLEHIANTIYDWQFEHGSTLKAPPRSGNLIARPVGAAMFPSRFPRRCFEEAMDTYAIFDILYSRVASDETWLEDALQPLLNTDSLAKTLWNIHQRVKKDGYVQDVSLGIFRSDYMLQVEENKDEDCRSSIKQVEFNTYSAAGGIHSNKVSDMHKYGWAFDHVGFSD